MKISLNIITRTYAVEYEEQTYLVDSVYYCNEDKRNWIVREVDDINLRDELIHAVKEHHNIKGAKM